MSMLTQQRVSVEVEGQLIALTFGELTVRMEYETALKVSQWIRVRAKQAKRLAGDLGRHWSAVGVLEDIGTDLREIEGRLPTHTTFDIGLR